MNNPNVDISLLKFDLIRASIEHLLVISFVQSNSHIYPIAVGIASGAHLYDQILIGKKLFHCSAFSRTREDAARARAVLQHIYGWKGIQVYAGGKLIQNAWPVITILECYLEAGGCNDWRAHCQDVIDDPYINPPKFKYTIRVADANRPNFKQALFIDRYLFPCSYLHSRFKFQIDHPATAENQIQAAAVKEGCDWCPNFNAGNYTKKGTRKIEYDIFE